MKERLDKILARLRDIKIYLRQRMDRINHCQIDFITNTSLRLPMHCKSSKNNEQYTIQYKDAEPYSSKKTRTFLENIIHHCCQNLSQIVVTNNNADLIYPVLGDTNSEMAYGYYFVPLLSPPGAFSR